MKTGILFDLDGTLLDTLEDMMDAVNHILNRFGCPPRTLDEVRQFVGNGAERLIRLALPGREDDPPLTEVLGAYCRYYADHAQEKTGPYAGVLPVLEEIRKRYPIAIVSNKPDIAVKPLCKGYFGDIYAMGETADIPRKPAPDMLYQAMAQIGVERCVYVGDSEVDLATARNAGMPCISVLWGFRDKKCLEEAGGRYFCQKPEELLGKIEEILHQEENHGQ